MHLFSWYMYGCEKIKSLYIHLLGWGRDRGLSTPVRLKTEFPPPGLPGLASAHRCIGYPGGLGTRYEIGL